MGVLKNEENCLKCHASQGFKVGDIRGGISILTPWQPYKQEYHDSIIANIIRFGLFWIAGIIALWFGMNRINASLKSRIKIEEALKLSEERYRSVVEDHSEIISRFDSDGKYIFVNDVFCQFFGKSRDELLSQKWFPESHPEDLENVRKKLNSMSPENPVILIENRVYSGKGELRWMQFMNRGFYNQQGALHEIQSIGRDITERKLAEDALRESKITLQGITDTAKDAILMMDPKGLITFWNPAAENILGYTPDEVIGMNLHDLLTPERFMEAHRKAYPDFLKTGSGNAIGKTVELYARHKDLHELAIELSLSSINFKNEWHAVGIIRDITDRKLAEEAIKRSEVKFHTLYDSTSDAVMLLNEKGFFDCNNATLKIFGCPSMDDFCSKHPADLSPANQPDGADSMDLANQQIMKAMEKGSNRFEWVHKRADTGEPFPAEVLLSAMKLDGKQVLQAVVLDISKRKQSEEIITKKNEELFKLNSEKDKFFSIIAHDLKSPFQGFLGLTKMMAENIQDLTVEEMQELGNKMHESADNLYQLLENLLEWSRMQRGQISFEPEVEILNLIVKNNIQILYETAQQKELELINLIPENIKIFADIHMFNTVIRNLVSNSLKFTPRGGKIEVGIGPESSETRDNNEISIYIKDTGIGMDETRMNKLFKVDQKVSRPGTEGESSTGLGLLLCKDFVEKHGGRIWVESQENLGSTFYFTMPKNAL